MTPTFPQDRFYVFAHRDVKASSIGRVQAHSGGPSYARTGIRCLVDGDELMEPIEGRVEISLRYSSVNRTVIGDKQPKQQRSRGNQRFAPDVGLGGFDAYL
jgi:hypothetical protein